MLITHDMGVIAETADRVAVMYSGRIAEIGPVHEVVKNAEAPLHPRPDGLDPGISATTSTSLTQIEGAMPRLHRDPRRLRLQPALPEGAAVVASTSGPSYRLWSARRWPVISSDADERRALAGD